MVITSLLASWESWDLARKGMEETYFTSTDFLLSQSALQVAERAFFLWKNDHIAVHGLTINIRKMFLEMDFDLFEECQKQHEEMEARARELEEQRELTWKRLAEAAEQRKGEDGITV
ncbi:Serine/threonine protein phosphatase 2A 57 kDa regulatory subunit B' beta isoform [Vitis vinifera]|uniref:Serine/threonine protein phosphatase 2A 57 kDa regulatory subunit B' beta isoform n=1 Tax=Vitis vinifera TaxID=29760 RepID=A0A438JSI8_VITVI|nr:Serine/threonine protein phosphatase 2A 57 kDa regulatory subunit B' beta isoform [Vitis vinifera]